MKASQTYLGQEIQLFLLRQGRQMEEIAKEMGISAEALSNLIHGRRRFKDETLAKLSKTRSFQDGGFSLIKLKALRAMDEYDLKALILALVEYLKKDGVGALPEDFFSEIVSELEKGFQT